MKLLMTSCSRNGIANKSRILIFHLGFGGLAIARDSFHQKCARAQKVLKVTDKNDLVDIILGEFLSVS